MPVESTVFRTARTGEKEARLPGDEDRGVGRTGAEHASGHPLKRAASAERPGGGRPERQKDARLPATQERPEEPYVVVVRHAAIAALMGRKAGVYRNSAHGRLGPRKEEAADAVVFRPIPERMGEKAGAGVDSRRAERAAEPSAFRPGERPSGRDVLGAGRRADDGDSAEGTAWRSRLDRPAGGAGGKRRDGIGLNRRGFHPTSITRIEGLRV